MIQIFHFGHKNKNRLLAGLKMGNYSYCYHQIINGWPFGSDFQREDVILFCIEDRNEDYRLFIQKLQEKSVPMTRMGFIFFFSPSDANAISEQEFHQYLPEKPTTWQISQAIRNILDTIRLKKELQKINLELQTRTQELAELNKIGIALSAERELDTLLELILQKAREITSADAGSLYLIEKDPLIPADENNFWIDKQLRFKLAHNDSISSSYQEFVMPVERKSMAGYTALSGRPLNIEDAYHLPKDSAFQHNRSFDERMGYRTKSVLCLPLHSHQGEMIGVLQLINRKRDASIRLTSPEKVSEHVIPFDHRCEELALSLASQAAVSIENMRLYEEIKRLFEGFIVASVHAIEQRDPTTFGHSERVAKLTVAMAEQVSREKYGPFRNLSFSRDDIQQIRYAALLHDFGKIGVREKILTKAKKLYPEQLETIFLRGRLIKKTLQLTALQQSILNSYDCSKIDSQLLSQENLQKQIQEIDEILEFIKKINEPFGIDEAALLRLQKISQLSFMVDDQQQPLLNKEEVALLSSSHGSLSPQERKEIESHVTHTFNFLSRIPWASHLKEVPNIAYSHHEKLDGSGYPRGLKPHQIPLPARMMTIADIFDALTAWDRPYKKAVSVNRALEILEAEAKAGKLDLDLLNLFIKAEIFRIVSPLES